MKRGFTLIELLVVITILAVLAGAAIPYVQNYVEESRIAKAKTDLEEIARALAVYETREGEYPDTAPNTADGYSDVSQLVGRYLNKAPIDPWGKSYRIDLKSGTVVSSGPSRNFDSTEDNISVPYQPPLALVSVKWVDRNQSGAVDVQNVQDQLQLIFSRKLNPVSQGFDATSMNTWFRISPDGETGTTGLTQYIDTTTNFPQVLSNNPRVVVMSLKLGYDPDSTTTTPLSPGAAYIYVSTPDSTTDLIDLATNFCIQNQNVKILPQ